MTILFIYDDIGETPATIRRIIGVSRFGDIVRRKRRLASIIQATVEAVPDCEFIHLSDAATLAAVRERIGRAPAGTMIFRLPSSIVPVENLFGPAVAKLSYALDPVIYGDPGMADAPALLARDDALLILGEQDSTQRRRFFRAFEQRAVRVTAVRFLDIAEVSPFLAFMAGATEARHFNVTSIASGIFRKWSRDVAKMRGEYLYFHDATERMKRFLLPTFDYAEENDGAAYSMEHMSVPDAAMQIQHHTFDAEGFGQLMDNFFSFIRVRERQALPPPQVRDAARRDIVDKLDRRMAEFQAMGAGRRLDSLLASVGPHGGLDRLVTRCKAVLDAAIAASRIDHLALGHGDPCFSNILYNAEINLFRLIDPRGAATREAGFTHPAYDLAKFSHSVLGCYDFVNGGLAETRLDEAMTLSLVMERGGPPAWMREAFRRRVVEEGWDLRLIRAVEASLFLSMLPLHVDSPDKLPAFCLIAGGIIEELETSRD